MAAARCDGPRFKRDLRSIEDGMTYNSRKIHKLDVQSPSTAQKLIFIPRQEKHIETETGKTETASNSKCQTSSQQQYSQEQLREIYGSRKYKNLKERFNFEESDDSEEEEEGQKGITEEECKDDREGYELTIKAFDAIFGKPVA